MPITLTFDPGRRVLMVSYELAYGRDGLARLDKALAEFVRAEGASDVIFDFTKAGEITLSNTAARQQGKRPTNFAGRKRALVASDKAMYGMLRLYAQYQELNGEAPEVFDAMDKALAFLGIDTPDFRPWPR